MTGYRQCQCPTPRPNGIDERMCVTCLGDIPRPPVRMRRIGWQAVTGFTSDKWCLFKTRAAAQGYAGHYNADVRPVYVRVEDD